MAEELALAVFHACIILSDSLYDPPQFWVRLVAWLKADSKDVLMKNKLVSVASL